MNEQNNPVIVVTRTKINPRSLDRFLEINERSMPIFGRQPGLLGMAFHLSKDQSEVMTYLEWRSVEDHEKCFVSPDFASVNPDWQELAAKGDLEFSLQIYDVIPGTPMNSEVIKCN